MSAHEEWTSEKERTKTRRCDSQPNQDDHSSNHFCSVVRVSGLVPPTRNDQLLDEETDVVLVKMLLALTEVVLLLVWVVANDEVDSDIGSALNALTVARSSMTHGVSSCSKRLGRAVGRYALRSSSRWCSYMASIRACASSRIFLQISLVESSSLRLGRALGRSSFRFGCNRSILSWCWRRSRHTSSKCARSASCYRYKNGQPLKSTCLGMVLTFWRSLRSLYALNPHMLPPTVLLSAAMASTASSMIGIV